MGGLFLTMGLLRLSCPSVHGLLPIASRHAALHEEENVRRFETIAGLEGDWLLRPMALEIVRGPGHLAAVRGYGGGQ